VLASNKVSFVTFGHWLLRLAGGIKRYAVM
jgi:hypothetical protein